MPADREPVSMAEVTAFLADSLRLSRTGADIDPAELLAYVERKASLLTRIADQDGTDESRAVAQAAREQLAQLRAEQSPPPAVGA
jgi:hypothetical protein